MRKPSCGIISVSINTLVYLVQKLLEVPKKQRMSCRDSNGSLTNRVCYVLMGYSDDCQNGNMEAHLQGVYSTEPLAKGVGDELVEAGVYEYYEIECPMLDECCYK